MLALGASETHGQRGEECLCGLYDTRIDFAMRHLLHASMLGYLACDAAVTTTNDQHLLWRFMREERHMCHHLLIRHLILLCQLDDSIEDKHLPPMSGLENKQVLEV